MTRGVVALRTIMVCAIGSATSIACAGDLTPPAGPVAPTMKPLDAIEPRTAVNELPAGVDAVHLIDQPGSYYLTGNIAGQVGKHGIRISADNVTLDLGGFTLIGVASSDHGIIANSVDGLTIRNGSVVGFGDRGIEASTSVSSVLERLTVRASTDKGIAAGFDSIVRDCIATGNGSDGIFTNTGALITGCVSNFNSADGFDLSIGCSILDCIADNNQGSGYFIIQHVTVSRCIARNNAMHGLVTGEGTSVSDSHFMRNTDHGIRVTNECSITNNRCIENTGPGIRVNNFSKVRGNFAEDNGRLGDAAGVLVEGVNNHIDNNTVISNTRGIEITAIDSIVTSNVASGNGTNFVIIAGNDVAPISSAATATSPVANIEN